MKNAVIFLCGLMAGLLLQHEIKLWEADDVAVIADKESMFEVRRSLTGLCHPRGSQFFDYLKHYTEYDSLNQCVLEGGRLPLRVKQNVSNSSDYLDIGLDSGAVQRQHE